MEREFIENKHEIGQCELIARCSGIELTDEEVKLYCWVRQSDDDCFRGQSDQRLLHLCVPLEKQIKLEKQYRSISF